VRVPAPGRGFEMEKIFNYFLLFSFFFFWLRFQDGRFREPSYHACQHVASLNFEPLRFKERWESNLITVPTSL